MKIICVIPARYASVRFPGKPLAEIKGKSLLRRVWENASRARRPASAVIATDDDRIRLAAEQFGAKVVMTSPQCASGTERVAEVARKIRADVYINVQGDEPLIAPETIDAVAEALESDKRADCATAVYETNDRGAISGEDVVKAVTDRENFALYFSRAEIPFVSRHSSTEPHYFKHIGIYAYRRSALLKISAAAACELEGAEKLEQLRLLWHGYRIKCVLAPRDTVGVDSPGDISKVEKLL